MKIVHADMFRFSLRKILLIREKAISFEAKPKSCTCEQAICLSSNFSDSNINHGPGFRAVEWRCWR